MRRRRFTAGRAFALLIVGVAVGAGLFLARQLDPIGIERQVRQALASVFQSPFELKAVVPRLGKGVELLELKVLYPDGTVAIEADRILLEVDHQRLLRGEIEIPRVEISGLSLTLRAPSSDRPPGLPDVFRTPETAASARTPARLPEVSLPRGGRNRIRVDRLPFLEAGGSIEVALEYLEGMHDGGTYRIESAFHGGALGRAEATVTYDPLHSLVAGRLKAPQVAWTPELVARLGPDLRKRLAAIEFGGRADLQLEAHVNLSDRKVDYLYAYARLDGVAGRFGNLHTGDPAGFPFGFRDGGGVVVLDGARLKIHDLEGVFVASDGREGRIAATIDVPLARGARDLDVRLTGHDVSATTHDLRLLLSPDAVHTVVDKYEPAGRFDLDLRIARRLGLPDAVRATLRLTDGKFSYAGALDSATGRRYGFRYPLEGCAGTIRFEGGVRTARGIARVVELPAIAGLHRLRAPPPGAPPRVAVTAHGRIITYLQHADEPEDVDVEITVTDLPIDGELAAAFAATREGTPYRAFDLAGHASRVRIQVRREAFGADEALADYDVELKDCSLAYLAFPIHLEGVHGTILSRAVAPTVRGGASGRVMELVKLEGRARDGGAVSASGTVDQMGSGAQRLDVLVRAQRLALGPDMGAAVEHATIAGKPGGDVWRRIRPSGTLDADIHVRGADRADVEIRLTGDAELAGFGQVDFPVRALRGEVSYRDGALALRGVEATLPRGSVAVDGEVQPDGTFSIRGRLGRFGLDARAFDLLEEALPGVRRSLAALEPDDESTLDVAVEASRTTPGGTTRFLATAEELALRARFAGVAVHARGGPVTVTAEGLRCGEVWLDAGAGQVHVREADVRFERGAGSRVLFDARGLHPVAHLRPLLGEGTASVLGDNLRVDAEAFELAFNRADGKIVVAGAVDLRRTERDEGPGRKLEPTGAFELAPVTIVPGAREGDPITFSGLIRFRGVDLNLPAGITDLGGQLLVGEATLGSRVALEGAIVEGRFTILGRNVEAAALNFEVDPHYVRLSDFESRFYGGALSGSVEIHLGPPDAFQLRVRAKDVDLSEFLRGERPSEEPMGGKTDFALDLESPSGESRDLAGKGEIRVREGALFEVPFFRTILALLGRVAPIENRPRFKNAAVDFTVRGETIEVHRLHLSTPVSDIYGRGEATIYGDLDLVIDPQVNRILDLPRFLNIPVLSALRNLWHRTVYEVRLGGTIDSPHLHLRALPFLKGRLQPITPSPHGGLAERIRPDVLP